MTAIAMRTCKRCGAEKPESEYYPRRRVCKVCAASDQRCYRETHKPEESKRKRRYREANKSKIAEREKRYYSTRKEETAEWQKRYREAHRQEAIEKRKVYYSTERGQALTDRRHARARMRSESAFVEDFSPREIYERDRWTCGSPKCPVPGKKVNPKLKHPHPFSASLDHIIPLALGGLHERNNVQLMHLGCNLSKGTKAVGCQLRVFG